MELEFGDPGRRIDMCDRYIALWEQDNNISRRFICGDETAVNLKRNIFLVLTETISNNLLILL